MLNVARAFIELNIVFNSIAGCIVCENQSANTHWRRLTKAPCITGAKKTKEMAIGFKRDTPPTQIVTSGEDIEIVYTYKYPALHLDNRLDWSINTDVRYRKGQSC